MDDNDHPLFMKPSRANPLSITRTDGLTIDLTPWEEQLRTNAANASKGHGLFERTPIGTKADGSYWWWDEEENPDLDTRSVKRLMAALRTEAI